MLKVIMHSLQGEGWIKNSLLDIISKSQLNIILDEKKMNKKKKHASTDSNILKPVLIFSTWAT